MEKCLGCKETLAPTSENCELFVYRDDPVCNHADLTCNNCGTEQEIFLSLDRLREYSMNFGLTPTRQMKAPEGMVARARTLWARLMDPALKTDDDHILNTGMYDLTARLRAEVDRFASNLEAMPDEELLRGMQDPAQRSAMPQRWID